MAKDSGIFDKAKATAGTVGEKIGDSMNEIKDQTVSVASKLSDGISSQSEKMKAVINNLTSNQKKEKPHHTVVELNGTKMKILLPDGYERLKYKNPLKEAAAEAQNTEVNFQKMVTTSNNIVMIFKTTPDKAMDPFDLQGLIDGIHNDMSDKQGIIEANKGTTRRGYKYIYSIVKNLSQEEFGGVRYFLRLNLYYGMQIVEIKADFTECGMTGQREAISMTLAQRVGLMDIGSNGMKGWSKDPYDDSYTRGCLKNLAEKEGLDALFPDNPLSQAHEFLLAVLEDKFVTTRTEQQGKNASSDDSNDNEEDEEKLLESLFVDRCRM